MTPVDNRSTLLLVAITLVVFAGTLVLIRPSLASHDEFLTIIRTRVGELDVNHLPGHRATIWWQEPDHGINARLLVLP
jgi:hypothetical protein